MPIVLPTACLQLTECIVRMLPKLVAFLFSPRNDNQGYESVVCEKCFCVNHLFPLDLYDLTQDWFDRFGSKCCRIFRLVLVKKHLEQKQVEEFAMIPAKEAKEHLYTVSTCLIFACCATVLCKVEENV